MASLYQIVQTLYWLLLASWLGGMVFVFLAIPIIFRVARRLEIRLPGFDSPTLIPDHPTIAAGEIAGALLARMAQVQMVCASLLLPLMLAQAMLIDLSGAGLPAAAIRFFLWLLAVILLAYEWRSHYPRTWRLRREYIDHVDNPERSEKAHAAFQREQRRSEMLFQITVFCLIGMVLFSANMTPRVRSIAPSAIPAVEHR